MIVSRLRDRLDRIGIVDSLWVLIGGGIATAMILVVVYIVGSMSGYSAL